MDEEEKFLLLENGHKLQLLPKDPKLFLHKTTLIFGGAQSGKTTILDEIMYLCKDIIPNIFVFSSTNTSNNTFTGKIPSNCIASEMHLEWLEKFCNRQKHITEIAKLTNTIDILRPIFKMVASNHNIAHVNAVIKRAKEYLISLDLNQQWNYAKKKAQKLAVTRKRDNTIIQMFKHVIRYHKCRIETMPNLTDIQRTVVEYLDVNPDAMLIFDDMASEFKKWFKKTSLFKKIFYEIRWMSLTVIITSQDDKEIDSELRKNSMVTCFTTPQAATSNFERASNSYSKYEKDMARESIKTVFKQIPAEPVHFQKLCYIRGDQDPFRYIIADLYDDFQFGCQALWELDKKIGNTNTINHANPFIKNKKTTFHDMYR